jgi:hypothetical protein
MARKKDEAKTDPAKEDAKADPTTEPKTEKAKPDKPEKPDEAVPVERAEAETRRFPPALPRRIAGSSPVPAMNRA